MEQKKTDLMQTSATPDSLLALAVQQGADIDKLAKLMDLKERWDAAEAKRAYIAAMTAFKENPPEIVKDKEVKYLSTQYNHASLWNVVKMITQSLSKHGLTAGWKTNQTEHGVEITCIITHIQGHSEQTTMTAPPDTSGKKNPIQAIASTITYLERYTLLALTGLAAQEQDDDGKAAGTEYISNEQYATLIEWLQQSNADEKKFLAFLDVEKLEDLPAEKFNTALIALKKKAAQNDNS